jgi:hypothetical protein
MKAARGVQESSLMMILTEAQKTEIRTAIAEGETTRRWDKSGGNGEGQERETKLKDGTEIGIARDPDDGQIRVWTLINGEEITDQI